MQNSRLSKVHFLSSQKSKASHFTSKLNTNFQHTHRIFVNSTANMDHNETSLLEKDLPEEEQARRDLVTQVEDWRNDIKRLIIEKDARVAMMQLEVKKSMMDDAVKVTEATIMIERKIRIATVHQEIKATSIAVYKRKMECVRTSEYLCRLVDHHLHLPHTVDVVR